MRKIDFNAKGRNTISTVMSDTGDQFVLAKNEISSPALLTEVAMTSMPADTNLLSHLPPRVFLQQESVCVINSHFFVHTETFSEFVDDSSNFMARNTGIIIPHCALQAW